MCFMQIKGIQSVLLYGNVHEKYKKQIHENEKGENHEQTRRRCFIIII